MNKFDTDEFLEHYGVKGMKWGQRRARRQELRSLNREAKRSEALTGKTAKKIQRTYSKQVDDSGRIKSIDKQKDRSVKNARKERDAAILKARERVESGKTDIDYAIAVNRYRVQKKEIGKYQARLTLAEARAKRDVDYANARATRDGGEAVTNMLVTVGSIALSSLRE